MLIGRRDGCLESLWRRGNLFGRHGRRFPDASLVDRFAKRVAFDVQLLGDFVAGVTDGEQLLRLHDDFGGHHRGATASARSVEAVDPFLEILRNATKDTVLRDSEGTYDLCLGTRASATELRREHPKGLTIVLRVLKDGLDAAEVSPLTVLEEHADQVTELGSPRRNEG